MSRANDDLIDVLKDLAATCRDSQEGFGKAAKGCHSDLVRDFFTGCSRQRAEFADELEREVLRLGGDPAGAGHFGGILHRGWVDLEARIRPKSDPEMIADCERGETGTLKHYQHALEQDLVPPDVRGRLENQMRAVEQVLRELRAFESGRAAG